MPTKGAAAGRQKPIRVLLTKSLLDAHDRGVRVVASILREAGMEVIFTRFGLPEEVVKTALEEDVDVIGISSSSHGHMAVAQEVMRLLKEGHMEDVLVIVGGIIPSDDIPELLAMGVGRVFKPAEPTRNIVDYIVYQKGSMAGTPFL